MEEIAFEGGVRCLVNSPGELDPAKPTRLVLYAAPAGSSIEQTIGRRVESKADWLFDVQHIGAQTRWLRARMREVNRVVAEVQAEPKSFVRWKHVHPDHPARVGAMVGALRKKVPGATLVLTGRSGGGSFTFSSLDGVEKIPDDVERIVFLDSNDAYDATLGHPAKLAAWLAAANVHRLVVLAYEDHVALLGGQTFVGEQGGTGRRSQAMLRDFLGKMAFTRSEADGLQRPTALGGRVEFLLKENPTKAVLHPRQVELNGFIPAMVAGTERAGQGYGYLGARASGEWITER